MTVRKFTTGELVSQRPTPEKLTKIERFPIYFLLNNIRSLENVGLCFRLADALRIKKLFLCGITGFPDIGDKDPRPYHVRERAGRWIEKTAIKTAPFVPFEYKENALATVKDLKKQGVRIVSLEQTTQSKDYAKVEYQFPVCLVVGHERDGVDDKILEVSDLIVEIPMYGIGNNLNVSQALAVAGYELVRRLKQ